MREYLKGKPFGTKKEVKVLIKERFKKAVIKSNFEKFASSISYAIMLDTKIHERI